MDEYVNTFSTVWSVISTIIVFKYVHSRIKNAMKSKLEINLKEIK